MSFHSKRIRAAALAGASILFLGAPGPAQAQTETEAAPETTAEIVNAQGEVERVIITGRLEEMLPQQLSQYGTRVDIVTAVEIQNGGYLDISQSLQNLAPGLYIHPKDGPFDYVDVSYQGSRTQDILWAIDGVRINNRLYAGTTPIDTIPSSIVERVEIIEGAQALFYGTQAIAGAINIITKDFSETPDGRVSVAVDTNGGRHVDGYFRDTLGGHRFVVYGTADKSEGFQPFPDEDYQPSATDRNRGYEVLTIGGKYAYDFSQALRVSINYQHTDAELDFARPARTSATASGAARLAINERREDILSAKIDYTPNDEFGLFVKGYYHWWYAFFTRYDNIIGDPGGNLVIISDHEFWGFTDYGVNALARYAPTGLGFEFYGGYDFQAYTGKDVVLYIEQQTENVHAVFGEIATTSDLFPNLRISAGIRHNMPSVSPSSTVWNVGARWDVIPDSLYVRGLVGTAFRLPTAEELFARDPIDAPNWIGNPDTKPERSTNVNVGIGGYFGDMRAINWEVVGFYREIEDLIDVTFDEVLEADVFGNIPGTVTVEGAQFTVNANINQDLSASISYTFNSAQLEDGEQIDRIPESYGNFSIDYHPMNRRFGLFAAGRLVGKTYRTLGGVGRTEYGDYVTVDLGARLFLDVERHHVINLTVQNLFDSEYVTWVDRGFTDVGSVPYSLDHLGWPRTFMFRYSYNFF
jgi:vitamin B12 transporter